MEARFCYLIAVSADRVRTYLRTAVSADYLLPLPLLPLFLPSSPLDADNKISIDGPTSLSFAEDVGKRYEAYGWHVQHVADGDLAAQRRPRP